MKLVIIRPEQGFKHSELSADIPLTHSRSLEEEQRGSYNQTWWLDVNIKFNCSVEEISTFNLINFDVQGQTTTLVQKGINVFSGGAIVERFFILTFSDVLVKAKVRVSCNAFFQDIQIVFSFPNQLNWF